MGKKEGVRRISSKNLEQNLLITADQESTFYVSEWGVGVTSEDKQKIRWSLIDPITNKPVIPSFIKGDSIQITISKKQAGKVFILEAATLTQDETNVAKIMFSTLSDAYITSTKWSLTPSGNNLKNGNPINYGDNIYLRVETEGINGNEVYVDVIADQLSGDALAKVYLKYRVTNGIIDIYIKDTYSWREKLKYWTSDIEKFYIKVKLKATGKYIKDKNGSEEHAKFLKIKDKTTSKKIALPSSANLPVKLGQNDIHIRQYEPCGYTAITIVKDDKYSNIILFNEKSLSPDKLKIDTQYTYNNIYYAFDKYNLTDASKKELNNVAAFLNQNPYIPPVVLGSHTDSRGTDDYNLKLSQRRSDSAVNYLISQGVSKDRIAAKGYGKSQLIVPDALTEEQHQQNRRTTLEFQIYNNNAEAIVYETIVPSSSHPVSMPILISDYKVNECFRQGADKHEKKVLLERIYPIGDQQTSKQILSVDSLNKVTPEIYSDFSQLYIWPESRKPVLYKFNINSCRYYNNKKRNTLVIKAYSDIKWTFNFGLNLTQPLALSWKEGEKGRMSEITKKDLQEKAGKVGAENRWKQKDASIKIGLKEENDKINEDNYRESTGLELEFETRIKKIYNLFSSIGNITSGITEKSKGAIRNSRGKNPIRFEIKPPNISFDAVWMLERVTEHNEPTKKIGTKVELTFKADPLIGIEFTIDLLAGTIGAVAGALSGGSAAPAATRIVNTIRSLLNEGVSIGDDDDLGASIKADIYIDLVVSGEISVQLPKVTFNTKGKGEQTSLELNGQTKISAEIKAGLYIKGKVAIIIVTAEGEFKVEASGKASISIGGKIEYKANDGLYMSPTLIFEGLTVQYILYFKVGLSVKKTNPTLKNSGEGFHKLKKDSIDLIGKTDLIEVLTESTGIDPSFKIF